MNKKSNTVIPHVQKVTITRTNIGDRAPLKTIKINHPKKEEVKSKKK